MEKYETGAVRDTGGKGRMDLLPMCALLRISKHMENANTHYPERNWEQGLPMHTMLDSAMRHLVKYMDGWVDEDHLCAAATNLLMALWTEEKRPDMQDIPLRLTEGPSSTQTTGGAIPVLSDRSVQEKTTLVSEEKCPCWHPELKSYTGLPQCWGTKEAEGCTCNGDRNKCDFK